MALTVYDILNTILDEGSNLYKKRVSVYNGNNLGEIGKEITADSNIMNEYINGLVNKIALSNVVSKLYKNPLARLKSSGVPMGSTIEEIFVNPAIDAGYDRDGSKLLKTTDPDGKVCYYALNRKSEYPITIYEADLQRGFTSEQEFMSVYNKIISSMYSGDNIDEFLLSKGVFAKAIDIGAMQVVASDESQPKELIKAITNMSSYFTFPSTKFAGYNLVNDVKNDSNPNGETPCITFCDKSRQCLLIRSDMQTEINFEVLAGLFNLSLVELKQMTIIVDSFPSTKYDVYAILCDIDAVQIRDVVYKTKSQDIGSALQLNYWLHHWQYLFISMFGNAVAFAKAKNPVTEITITGQSSVTIGNKISLSADLTYTDTSYVGVEGVTWSTNDPTVATVTTSGQVIGIKAGTVTITATAKDSSGITATHTVTVS